MAKAEIVEKDRKKYNNREEVLLEIKYSLLESNSTKEINSTNKNLSFLCPHHNDTFPLKGKKIL